MLEGSSKYQVREVVTANADTECCPVVTEVSRSEGQAPVIAEFSGSVRVHNLTRTDLEEDERGGTVATGCIAESSLRAGHTEGNHTPSRYTNR